MKTKHTPGPWEVKAIHGSQYSRYEVHDTIGNDIVLLDYEIGDENEGLPTNEQREADARLIAAAPELLEALQKIYRVVSDGEKMSDGAGKHRMLKNAQWLAAQAIAKAKGES